MICSIFIYVYMYEVVDCIADGLSRETSFRPFLSCLLPNVRQVVSVGRWCVAHVNAYVLRRGSRLALYRNCVI